MLSCSSGHLLRIFIGEKDKYQGKPLYEWIVRQARDRGLSGTTVIRGLEGFGTHNQIHTSKLLELSLDLPVIIEIVDSPEKIENFFPIIDNVIEEGLATLEKVDIRIYRKRSGASSARS